MTRTPRALALAACLAAMTTAAAETWGESPAYAIIIGQNEPPRGAAGENLPRLRYADDDAVRYAQLFGRFATTRLLTVLDEPTQRRYPGVAETAERPTLANVRRAVADVAARMKADRARGARPVFYFVFSGHGARTENGEAFLALADGELTEEILYNEVLAAVPSSTSHVIIDACHAGGVVGARGFFDVQIDGRAAAVDPARASQLLARRAEEFPHVGFIVASTLGQEAHEWSEIEAGVFSHALLSGLFGPADVNGDLRIEYSEAQAFVAAAVRDLPDPRAIPTVIAEPPRQNRNAALLSLSDLAGVRLVSGDFGRLGHFFIELENGQRYLDAHVVAGERQVVALPRRGRAFLRTATSEAELPSGDAPVELDDLRFRGRSVAARGSLDASYRAALFSSAYGSDYYRGFVDSIGAIGVRFGPPRRLDVPAEDTGRRGRWSLTAASVGGVSATASVSGLIVAYRAKRAFESTDLQRPAHEAKRRYERALLAAGVTGVTALAGGLVAWRLWPSAEDVAIAPVASGRGDYGVSLRLRF
jgi:hypothetical protein